MYGRETNEKSSRTYVGKVMGAKNTMRRDADDERPGRRASTRSNSRRACFYLDASRVSSHRSSRSVLQKPARNDGDARREIQSVDDDDVADVVGTSRGGASRAILSRASRIRTIVISTRRAAQTSSHRRRALARPCLLYTSPSPRDMRRSRMPSSA